VFGLEDEDYAATFVSIDECAAVMNTTPERLRQYIKLRVLGTRYQWGTVMVQPVWVPGWTD
jgi:hypothetical protein